MPSSAALCATALCGPAGKLFELQTVFPGQSKKISCVEIGRLRPEKCFKTPAYIRTLPGIQAVTVCSDPVIAKKVQFHAQINKMSLLN